MANPTGSDARGPGPAEEAPALLLVGYDIDGFSGAVERLSEDHGREAAEMAAAALDRGSRAVADCWKPLGLEPFDPTGDGLLFACPAPDGPTEAPIAQALADAAKLHLAASGLAIRCAHATGPVRLLALDGRIADQPVFRWGRPLHALHSQLAAMPRSPPPDRPGSARGPAGWLADCDGRLQHGRCLFVRLATARSWRDLDEATLRAAIDLAGRWGESAGAAIERLGHDEKGIMLRFGLPGGGPLDPRALHSLVDALTEVGVDAAAACTEGDVFRARIADMPVVHGRPINLAAKRCAALAAGEVFVAPAPDTGHREPAESDGEFPLIGRSVEVAKGVRFLKGPAVRCLTITGPSGIGKTRLARAVADAVPSGLQVRHECGLRNRFEAFGLVRDILIGLAATLEPAARHAAARDLIERLNIPGDAEADCLWLIDGDVVAPARVATPARADRAARIRLFAEAFIGLFAHRDILLIVDDAHLADPYSMSLLCRWAAGAGRLRLILTVRDDAPAEALAGLPPDGANAMCIRLGKLPASAVEEIVRRRAPSCSGPVFARLVALADGNPFAVMVASHATASGVFDSETGFFDLLRARIDALPRLDRLVLRIISVANEPLGAGRVGVVLGRMGQERAAAAAIGRLVSAGLAEHVGSERGVVRPGHDLVRAAVRGTMSIGATVIAATALARTAGDAAASRRAPGSGWSSRGQLWEAAREFGRASVCYARGGQAALDAGFAPVARDLLGRAIEAAERAGGGACLAVAIWRVRAAEADWASGRLAAAADGVTRATASLRRFADRPRARNGLILAGGIMSETGYFQGRFADMLRGGSLAARYAGLQQPRTLEHCRSSATIGYIAGVARIPFLPALLFARAHRLARVCGDYRPEAYVRATEGILDMIFCRWQACDGHLARSIECLAAWPAERQLLEVAITAQGHSAIFQGDFALARARFAELGQRAADRDNDLHRGWADYMTAQINLCEGRISDARTGLLSARNRLTGLGDTMSDHIVAGLSARLALEAGDSADALALAEAADASSRAVPPTNFSSLEGFAAAPLVAACTLRTGPERPRAAALLARSLPPLRRFAWLFPLARARLALVETIARGYSGSAAEAARHVRRHAACRGMQGEVALANRLLGPDPDERMTG